MPIPKSPTAGSKRPLLDRAAALNRPERIVLLVFIGAGVAVDAIGFFSITDHNPLQGILSILCTLLFALFLWSPPVATLALGLAIALSYIFDNPVAGLLTGAMAAAPVMRLGSSRLIASYTGGLLIFTAGYSGGLARSDDRALANVALALLVAAFAGGVGLALRTATARRHRLERELRQAGEREREAIVAERQWIAGELHDSIAHYLTIIALHVQMLDDDAVRPQSQEAIQIAARKALSDLRFVIELAEESPHGTSVNSGDLAEAITEATAEFETAGHLVSCFGDPTDERIPRGVEIILARIVRESATNILKYAGPGEVRFVLIIDAEAVDLQIFSPLPEVPRQKISSTGTGLNRMAERVLGVNGKFTAGANNGVWLVSVHLPTG